MTDSLKKFLNLKNKDTNTQKQVETPKQIINNDNSSMTAKDHNVAAVKAISTITLPDGLPGCNFICANENGTVSTFDLITTLNTNITNQINTVLIPSINTAITAATESCDCDNTTLEAAITANTNAITNINLIIGGSSTNGLQGRVLVLENLVIELTSKINTINTELGVLNPTLGTVAYRLNELEACCENGMGGEDCSYAVVIPQQAISFNIPAQTVQTGAETCTSTPF